MLLLVTTNAMGNLDLTKSLYVAIGVLASVVTVLFAYLRSTDARQQKKLDECEEDRRNLWEAIIDLGGKYRNTKRK